MIHFMSRALAVALLTASTFALAANAQAPSNTAPGQNADLTKHPANQANDPTNQNKNPAPSDKAAAKDRERQSEVDNRHAARQARTGDKNSQDQSMQNAPTRLNPTKAPQQNSAALPGEKSPRDSANQQPPATLQSGNQPQNNQQTGRDKRDARSGSSTAREYAVMKPTDMRGPDIGLWFNRSNHDALVIGDVSSHGPIARLGFREGDRVVSVNGHRVAREADFIDYLLGADRDRVEVVVNRDGRDETVWVEPAQFAQNNGYEQVEPIEQFGVVLDDRYDDRIVVWRVIPRSPAFYAGIREGDVISTYEGRPFTSRTEFEKSVADWRTGEAQLQVRRGDRNRNLTVEVPDFSRSSRHDEPADRNDRSNNRATDNRSIERNNDRNQQANREQSNRDQDDGRDRNNSDRSDQSSDKSHGNQPTPNTSGGGGEHREGK